ncbi:MAG: AMP-binding protein [Acidimicrobiales bacterium]|nr:AMP-binding protein [Acidimicrobiales bacterium]
MTVTSAEIDRVVAGQTIPTEFLKTVSALTDQVALRWRNDDESWGSWTWRDYADRVAQVAAGYRALGVQPGQRIVLMLRNIPEFHIADLAACFVGATPVSIYNSSSPEQIQYLANHCDAVLALVEDIGFLERFLKVRSELPKLANLVVLRDPDGLAPGDVYRWESLFDHGSVDLDEAAKVASPDDLATLIYTSGTTGPPKAVMISHYNVSWTVESLRLSVSEHPAFSTFAGKKVVSYLPMAHIAERMVSHYQGCYLGYEVTTCPDPTGIAAYLREVKPNFVFGVPRVWEKIHAGVVAALAADPERQQQFNDGVAAAEPLAEKIDWGTATEEEKATWDFLQAVFAQVRSLIGLDECELAVTGAAPIPADLLRWFRAIGVPLTEIYGMSESTGPMTYRAIKIKPGTVGIAIPGCEVKLADDGEIICRGGNVFQGYLHDPEKTAETIDEDGWLHSGDIGEVDEDGYFKIVDRKKELIITAGGKNISPANLEAALKLIPLVGQACAIGDQRPFVAALVVLDPEVAPAWATQRGIEFETLQDLAEHPEVQAEIERGLEEVMAPFNNAERVKKVKILADEWLPDSDVLTPTSKLKRRGVHARYAVEIESLYT